MRYPCCILVSAIRWCGALSGGLHCAWLVTHIWWERHIPDGQYVFNTFLPGFLSAAVAVIAWHFRKDKLAMKLKGSQFEISRIDVLLK